MCASLLVLLGTASGADTQEDEGLWLLFAGQGTLASLDEDAGDLRWWFDGQLRFSDAADGLGQTLVRPGLGYTLSDTATGWLGYAWILTEQAGGGHSREHRIWQQLTWSPKVERFNLSSRTRLEQRFLDSGDDVGWRLRQFVKGTFPIAPNSPLFVSAYDEVFFDLNSADWGQRPGFSQNRLFLGLGWKLDSLAHEIPLSVEAGYLNQFTSGVSRPNRMNHILSLNLFLNL